MKIPAKNNLSPAVELCFTYFTGAHWMMTTFKLVNIYSHTGPRSSMQFVKKGYDELQAQSGFH